MFLPKFPADLDLLAVLGLPAGLDHLDLSAGPGHLDLSAGPGLLADPDHLDLSAGLDLLADPGHLDLSAGLDLLADPDHLDLSADPGLLADLRIRRNSFDQHGMSAYGTIWNLDFCNLVNTCCQLITFRKLEVCA